MKPIASPLLQAALVLSLAALPACSSSDGDADGGGGEGGTGAEDPTEGAPTAWAGSEPHLDLRGEIAGKVVELNAMGSAAADLGTVYCERNYIVPSLDDTSAWADEGFLEKVEFKFNFFFDEALAEFQMELVAPNLADEVGTTLVIPDTAEANVAIAVDEDGPNAANYEDVGSGGSVTLEALTGEVGDDGLTIPDEEGTFALFVDIELESGGALQGSLTVNCGENDLEIPE